MPQVYKKFVLKLPVSTHRKLRGMCHHSDKFAYVIIAELIEKAAQNA